MGEADDCSEPGEGVSACRVGGVRSLRSFGSLHFCEWSQLAPRTEPPTLNFLLSFRSMRRGLRCPLPQKSKKAPPQMWGRRSSALRGLVGSAKPALRHACRRLSRSSYGLSVGRTTCARMLPSVLFGEVADGLLSFGRPCAIAGLGAPKGCLILLRHSGWIAAASCKNTCGEHER